MKQIAIYGKGGIGKSTVSANLSAALSAQGLRVLQIGCDPKHDSTRLLLGGAPPPTVLEMLKDGGLPTLSTLLREGFGGVHCLEAGGPEPGVGCAGRGILSMAQTLDRIGLRKEAYDIVLYDVLGDVVCGGFAVPMRDGYADAVLIVTSGELMALYAANNICKGLLHFTAQGGKLAGIIGNERQIPRERELLEAFAQAVGSRLLAFFSRDPLFREAELEGRTVVELQPDSPIAKQFHHLAWDIANGLHLVKPQPLSEPAFEKLIYSFARGKSTRLNASLSKTVEKQVETLPPKTPSFERYLTSLKEPYTSKAVRQQEPLYSCALAGAFGVSNQIRDAVTVMHAPSGCAHTSMDAAWLAGAGLETKSTWTAESALLPNLLCTNITESEAVFGGEGRLEETLREILERRRPRAIFVITSCPTAIIGDDARRVAEAVRSDDCPVIPLDSDGIMKGDYAQGWINAYRNIAEALIDPGVKGEPGWVNLVGETAVANNAEQNFHEIRSTLLALGLRIHARFLRDTSVGAIRQFKKASLNILASADSPARRLQEYLTDRFDAPFVKEPFPSGFLETARWVRALGARLGCSLQAEEWVEGSRQRYHHRLETVRKVLAGKRILIFSYTTRLGWLIEALKEAGMEILQLGLAASAVNETAVLEFDATFPVLLDYPLDRRAEDIRRLKPNIVLSNYALRGEFPGTVIDTLPLCPPAGFSAGIVVLERLSRRLRAEAFVEGWRSGG